MRTYADLGRPLVALCFTLSIIVFGHFGVCQAQVFTEVGPTVGVIHTLNSSDNWGSGVNFFDFDGDGLDDLTLLRENDSLYFYKNTGGQFVPLPSFVSSGQRAKQLLWVDIDNDGDFDILLSSYQGAFKMYLNDGDFNFTDVTEAAGFFTPFTTNYGISCADYDRDGLLDIHLCRYTGAVPNPDINYENALYRNNGDGTFTNVALEAGISDGLQPSFMGVWVDVNNDLWPDLFVINDRSLWGNSLYINNADGTFSNHSLTSGVHGYADDPMSATAADINNDGLIDLLTSNAGTPNKTTRLFMNQGGATFDEQALQMGMNVDAFSWGITPIDVHNTGYQDLFICTGNIGSHFPEVSSRLYYNLNGEGFTLASDGFGISTVAASYASARGDFNNDGKADLIVQNAKTFLSYLFRNDSESSNAYVKVTLEGVVSNKMAIGSRIQVFCGDKTLSHFTQCGEDYVSQSSQHHIFGLGDAAVIDSLVIAFPSGQIDFYYNLNVNAHYHFIEGAATTFNIDASSLVICEGEVITLSVDVNTTVEWSHTDEPSNQVTITAPGIYTATIYSSAGVPITQTIEILGDNHPPIEVFVQDLSCNNSNDGQIAITADMPTDAVSFTLDGLPAGWTITGLSSGDYELAVVSSLGCIYTQGVTINQPDPIDYFFFSDDILCYGDSAAAVFISFGGTLPHAIDWPLEEPSFVVAGGNTFKITDANGCELESTHLIEQPDEIQVAIIVHPTTLVADVSGGVAPYAMTWTLPSGANAEGEVVETLESGLYALVVTDANNCNMHAQVNPTSVPMINHHFDEPIIYPNPVSQSFWLNYPFNETSVIHIFDACGKQVEAYTLQPQVAPYRIHTDHFSNGIYLLSIPRMDGTPFLKRFIVAKD